jgi:hypothetical protein
VIRTKKAIFLATFLTAVFVCMALATAKPVLADTVVNVTEITIPAPTVSFNPSFLIEMALIFGGIATLGFVVAELVGMYVTKSAQTSIVQTTTTGINAIVSMTTLAVTGAQAAAVAEISGVPTQITTPPATTTKT